MTKQDGKKDGLLKAGTSRRSRTGRTGRGNTMPRIMVLALLIILAGGAALFWPRGGSVPTGIGENQTIVTTPADSAGSASAPRSGNVDIDTEGARPLTPEKKEGGATTGPAAGAETAPVQPAPAKPESKPKPKPKPKPASKPASKPVPRIEPRDTGPYAIQAGAFGAAENADKEAARLKALGWPARVRAGNNSSGGMVFRVWIGFFASRSEAQSFINQNSRHLPGAIPVHR